MNPNVQIIVGFIIVGTCAVMGSIGGIMIKQGFERKKEQYTINQTKPDLDLFIFNHGKIRSLNQGITTFTFEPEIVNNGKGIARYINLHIKFPNDLIVEFNKNIWFLYREGVYNVLEYKGGITNVVHAGNRMGLYDLHVNMQANFKGTINIPFWIICENMDKKEGSLRIEVK